MNAIEFVFGIALEAVNEEVEQAGDMLEYRINQFRNEEDEFNIIGATNAVYQKALVKKEMIEILQDTFLKALEKMDQNTSEHFMLFEKDYSYYE